MKKKLVIITSIAVFSIITVIVAQKMSNHKNPRLNPEKRAELQTQKMTGIYQLTEDQQKKVYVANLDFQIKLLDLNKDKTNTINQEANEARLKEAHEIAILPILTEAQKIKWNEHKEYRRTHPKEKKK